MGGPSAIANSGGATSTVTYQSLSLVGNQLSISNGNTVDLSSLVVSVTGPIGPQGPQGPTGPAGPAGTGSSQQISTFSLDASNTLTIAITGGNTETVDLSNLNQDIAELDFDTMTNFLTVGITDGASQTISLSQLDQDIAELAFNSTTNSLTVGITDGASQTISLSQLDQDIAELDFDTTTNSLTVGITDGASQTISLSQLDQDIAELNFNPAGNILTVGITGGASETTSFATLGSTTVSGSLTVNGPISQTGTGVLHPDYVFESYFDGVSEINKDYRLPSLSEIESFVRENKHLPGVQSRADIQTKGRWDVGENVRTNLEKVEELYLHTIEQQKQIEAQQKEIDELKALLHQLLNHRKEKK